MEDRIEIYVRNSADRTLLNLYVPARLRAQLLKALKDGGTFSDSGVPMALELSPLPEWITDDDERERAGQVGPGSHLRIPITSINLQFTEAEA